MNLEHQLSRKIKSLEKDNKKLLKEMAERGEELEKLRDIIETQKESLPMNSQTDRFIYELEKPIRTYMLRCTEKNGQKRLRNAKKA